ncbi:MAG: HNH endonuclease [Candidatus Methanoperedens sp.]|nr:HNH endonuclease [Candidatus Methanoperedens sp.]
MFFGNEVSNNFSYPENNAHHLIRLYKGGKNELANLICVCDQCHSILHHNNSKLEKKAEITEIFEDTQDFHSIEDDIIAPF